MPVKKVVIDPKLPVDLRVGLIEVGDVAGIEPIVRQPHYGPTVGQKAPAVVSGATHDKRLPFQPAAVAKMNNYIRETDGLVEAAKTVE